MRPVLKAFLLFLGLAAALGLIGLWYFVNSGVSAKEQPGRLEEFVARRVRNMAIARRAKSLTNPVEYAGEIIADGRAHFADHCAICHSNDGSGNTPIGRGMWPKVPDMRLPQTQNLSDGELFWIIENGIRFTGMPAWSTGAKEGETAKLASRALRATAAEANAGGARGDGSTQPKISRRDPAANRRGGIPERRRRQAASRTHNAPQTSGRTR